MRRKFEKTLGEEIRDLAIETSERSELTQNEIGSCLPISKNSRSDLETGETLLLSMQKKIKNFVDHVTIKFTDYYREEMQSVL